MEREAVGKETLEDVDMENSEGQKTRDEDFVYVFQLRLGKGGRGVLSV